MKKYRVYYRVTIACEVDIDMPDKVSQEYDSWDDEAYDKGCEIAWNNTFNIPNLIEFWDFEVDKVEEVTE